MNEQHGIFLRFVRQFFLPIIIAAVLVLLGLSFEAGRYSVYLAHPELSAQDQVSIILQKVGMLIQLPSGETPTMATIKDAATAKEGQPFLANAQNGDILIVYQTAQTALLYRPSTNKLIAVGPVSAAAGNQSAQQLQNLPEQTATSTLTKNATTTTPKKK